MIMNEKERNAFIEKNYGIIGDIAKPYKELATKYGYQYEDLFNSGVIGMIEGIDDYDENKATKEEGIVPLEAWVRYSVKKHISNFIAKPRKGDRLSNKVSMDEPVHNNAGTYDFSTVGDMIANEEHHDNHGGSIDREKVRELLNSGILSAVEMLVIDGRFLQGIKFKHLDEMVQKFLGNPKAKAFHYVNTGLKKLQDALAV